MTASQLAASISKVIINPILALLFAGALIVFVWGVVQFMWGMSSDAKNKEEGKQHMLWGIIGMFIMVAAYAILNIIANTIGATVPRLQL